MSIKNPLISIEIICSFGASSIHSYNVGNMTIKHSNFDSFTRNEKGSNDSLRIVSDSWYVTKLKIFKVELIF